MRRSIALICDDNYVMPTIVTIQSIIESYIGHYDIDIYICTYGLSQSNCDFFSKLSTKRFGIKIIVCSSEIIQKNIGNINQKTHVTPSSLIKFELPNILPNVDKLLYLDSDIIVKGNIEELFDIDISDYYLAASPEIWKYLDRYWAREDYKLEYSYYFNSGVLLYNMEKMRSDSIPGKLWQRKIENSKDISKKTMDQDTLNDICASCTLILPIVWNLNTAFTNSKVINIGMLNRILKTEYQSHKELVEDARILHYVGKEDKPWNYSSANCVEYWDKVYNKTDLASHILVRDSLRHSLAQYISIIKDQYKRHGFHYTVRYLYYKIKNLTY